jgi:hypothetical protein
VNTLTLEIYETTSTRESRRLPLVLSYADVAAHHQQKILKDCIKVAILGIVRACPHPNHRGSARERMRRDSVGRWLVVVRTEEKMVGDGEN